MKVRQRWGRVKQRFKNLSLKKKLFFMIGSLLLISIIFVFLSIYLAISRNMQKKILYSAETAYVQTESYLEDTIKQLIQWSDVAVSNSAMKELLDFTDAAELNRHQQLARKDAIVSFLRGLEGRNQNVRFSIYVREEYPMMLSDRYIRYMGDLENASWYQNKQGRKIYFAPGVYLEKDKDQCIALVRDITEDDDYAKVNSVLRMDISNNQIGKVLQNAVPTENGVVYLINEQNIVVSASSWQNLERLGLSGQELPEEYRYNAYLQEQGIRHTRLMGKQISIRRSKIDNTDWEMIMLIPQGDMVSEVRWVLLMVFLVLVCFAVLVLVGVDIILSWMMRRISVLNAGIQNIDPENPRTRLNEDVSDEIGQLYGSYNRMLDRIQQLLDEKLQIGLRLKSAELKALQAQINPHFLYNTLDMVNWLAYGGQMEEIHESVIALSKYYRLVLNKGQDTLTLREELQHVMYYVKIQNIRFAGKIRYVEHVDPQLQQLEVPKIILQPLVENAILHGIRETSEKSGTVRVTGFRSGEDIFLKVTDDGVGMDEETLKHIMDKGRTNSHGGYGVRNVDARLRLTFGEEYGLQYTCIEGKGVCVTIRLPGDRIQQD